jgi:nucleotide-binding universal stress UspA family protein
MTKTSTYLKTRFGSLCALCALALALALAAGCGRASTDLTVRVTDQEGAPVPGAMVALSENGQTLLADLQGQVTWTELDAEQASLVIYAEGYLLQSRVIPLERGANETTLALEKKPYEVPYQPPNSP